MIDINSFFLDHQTFGQRQCKSVNYNKGRKFCQLLDKNEENFDEKKFEENEEWDYYGQNSQRKVCFVEILLYLEIV